MANNKFILSDESINSYNLIIETDGLILDRFIKHSAMGNEHSTSARNIIGRWDNIQKEGTLLTATAVFDMEDPEAALIAGKVDRGFLKATSLGLDVLEFTVPANEGEPIRITKAEVIESSIVGIGSNENALKLSYKANDLTFNDKTNRKEIKLFLSKDGKSNEILNKNQINMTNKKVETKVEETKVATKVEVSELDTLKLSLADKDSKIEELAASKVELGLSITNLNTKSDELTAKNDELTLSLKASNDELEVLKNDILDLKNDKLNVLLDSAIEAGKITTEAKEDFLDLSFERVESILGKINVTEVSLASTLSLNKANASGGTKDFDWYLDNDIKGLKKLSKENPALYKQLENNKYKNK